MSPPAPAVGDHLGADYRHGADREPSPQHRWPGLRVSSRRSTAVTARVAAPAAWLSRGLQAQGPLLTCRDPSWAPRCTPNRAALACGRPACPHLYQAPAVRRGFSGWNRSYLTPPPPFSCHGCWLWKKKIF